MIKEAFVISDLHIEPNLPIETELQNFLSAMFVKYPEVILNGDIFNLRLLDLSEHLSVYGRVFNQDINPNISLIPGNIDPIDLYLASSIRFWKQISDHLEFTSGNQEYYLTHGDQILGLSNHLHLFKTISGYHVYQLARTLFKKVMYRSPVVKSAYLNWEKMQLQSKRSVLHPQQILLIAHTHHHITDLKGVYNTGYRKGTLINYLTIKNGRVTEHTLNLRPDTR